MTLRQAIPSDAEALDALERSVFTAENFPLSRRALYYHIRHNLLLVAEMDTGAVAGYALALVRRRDAKLYSLGVAPQWRRHGIAALLMRRTLSELAERNFRRCLLEVRCDNGGAIALYREFGFRVTERLPAFYGDGTDAYRMARSVSEESPAPAFPRPNSSPDASCGSPADS